MKVRKLIRNGEVRWQADCGEVGGQRIQKLFRTKLAAEGHLFAYRAEREQYGTAALVLPHDKRVEYLEAEKRLAGIATIAQAVDFFLAHRKSIVPRTIKAVIDDRVAAMRAAGKRELSIKSAQSTLLLLFRNQEDKLISDFTLADLEALPAIKNVAAATRRSRIGDLHALFSFAIKRKYILENVALNIERPGFEDGPVKILTVDQVAELFKVAKTADPDLAANLALVAFGGLRPMEAQRLPEGAILQDHINVAGTLAKTRQRRLVTITPPLRAWLAVGKPYRPKNFWNRLLAVRRACACPWSHDILRHSFCSYAFALHGARWTSEQAGHSEDMLFKHYREVVTKQQAEAYWAILP